MQLYCFLASLSDADATDACGCLDPLTAPGAAAAVLLAGLSITGVMVLVTVAAATGTDPGGNVPGIGTGTGTGTEVAGAPRTTSAGLVTGTGGTRGTAPACAGSGRAGFGTAVAPVTCEGCVRAAA